MIAQPTRRGVLRGLLWVAAAPAIVRASSLMPVKALAPLIEEMSVEEFYVRRNQFLAINAITREAVRLWRNSNEFLKRVDEEYPQTFRVEDQLIIRRIPIT